MSVAIVWGVRKKPPPLTNVFPRSLFGRRCVLHIAEESLTRCDALAEQKGDSDRHTEFRVPTDCPPIDTLFYPDHLYEVRQVLRPALEKAKKLIDDLREEMLRKEQAWNLERNRLVAELREMTLRWKEEKAKRELFELTCTELEIETKAQKGRIGELERETARQKDRIAFLEKENR